MKQTYLIYLRRESLPRATPELLAAALGVSRADANRVVRSKIPKAIAACDAKEEARAMLRSLRGHGLEGVAVTLEALKRFQPVPVERGRRRGRAIVWSASAGPALLKPDDVRMIVVGKIHEKTETRTTVSVNPTFMSGVGMGLMMGPCTGTGFGDRESSQIVRGEESFCCLFKSREEAYLVLETRFEYRSLLPKLEITRERSFLSVARMARETYPGAVYDETLYRSPAAVRMLAASMGNLGGDAVAVVRAVRKGSTAQKAMMVTGLLYLQAFGGA